MKRIVNKLIRGERGQVLILTVILLLVGGLITTQLLGFMSTGLIVGQVFEKKMDEIYAADAGVELAIWELKLNELVVLPDDPDPTTLPPFTMNDKDVDVIIEALLVGEGEPQVFRITSTADDTTIESYLAPWDLSFFLDNAITSGGEITLTGGGESTPQVEGNQVENYPQENWPTVEEMIAYYMMFVDPVDDLYSSSTLNVRSLPAPPTIGPLYRDGDLSLTNLPVSPITVELGGTVYIAGAESLLDISPNGLTVDLNGQTIFCEGDIYFGPQVAISGSGCIIAVGDIDFQPQIPSGSPDDFVFVMSLTGTVHFKPQNDFYGAIAGNVVVELMPGVDVTWTEPPSDEEGGLNFPTGSVADLRIVTWEINPPQ